MSREAGLIAKPHSLSSLAEAHQDHSVLIDPGELPDPVERVVGLLASLAQRAALAGMAGPCVGIRLEYGESTPFDVLQRERDLVSAESEKIDALRAYRVAATELARAQGTILRDRNIVIEDVAQLR